MLTERLVPPAIENDVIFSADRNEMAGIHTAFVFTGMMEIEMIGHLTHEKEIGSAMGWNVFAVEGHHSISLWGAITSPFPAACFRFLNATHQALKRRQSVPTRHTYQFSGELQ